MAGKLRVGVIGCGRIAVMYRGIFKMLAGVAEPVFAVDKIPRRAQDFAEAFPGCGHSADIGDLLAAKPDVVHILTPHFLHKPHAIACLRAGCHVLCEKPIATTLADAQDMQKAAEETGKKLGIIFQNRYIEGVREAKRLIEEGAFGRLTGAWSMLNWWRPPSYYECDWKGSWEKEGGGVVIDQAIHSLDLVRYLMGCEPVAVRSHIARRVLTNIEVEDVADAAITYENGAVHSFFACNYFTSNTPIQIEISGEKGSIHLRENVVTLHFADGTHRVVEPKPHPNTPPEAYWGHYHYDQMLEFYHCLETGAPVPVQPGDATATLKLVLDIYAQAGKEAPTVYPGAIPAH